MPKTLRTESLQSYFHQSQEFYYLLTTVAGDYCYANPLFESFFETTQLSNLLPAGEKQQYLHLLEECAASPDKIFRTELAVMGNDHTRHFMVWECQAITDDAGIAIQHIGHLAGKQTTRLETADHAERFRAYEHSAQGLWRLDFPNPVPIDWSEEKIIQYCREHGYVGECNTAMAKMYGLESKEELIGKKMSDLLNFEEPRHLMLFTNFIRNGFQSVDGESEERDINGGRLCFLNNMSGIVEDGLLLRVWGTQQDITERRKAEEQLVRSELFYRNLISESLDGILLTDTNGTITFAASSIQRILGFEPEELLRRNAFDYVHEEDRATAFAAFEDEVRMEPHSRFITIRLRTRDENWIWCTVRGHNMLYNPYVGRMIIYFQDDTQRVKTEAELQESRSKLLTNDTFYKNLIANSLDGILITSQEGKILYASPSAERISGYSADQLMQHNLFDFVHPEEQQLGRDSFQRELFKKSVVNYQNMRLLHGSGHWVWAVIRAHNIIAEDGEGAMVIYFADDSRRKQIEDRLRDSEQRFRNLINNLNTGVVLQDAEARVVLCNRAAYELLGLTESQLLGRTSFDPSWNAIRENGESFAPGEMPVPWVISSREPVRDVVMGVYRPPTNDRVWLLVNAEPVFDKDGAIQHVICSFTDITEQKKLSQALVVHEVQKQKQVLQATIDAQEQERKEIGKELHDNINQHLTTTRLYLEVALEKTAQGESREMMVHAHRELTEIIRELRTISQTLVPPTLGDIGLVESVEDVCDSLRRTLRCQLEFNHRSFDEDHIEDNLKLMLFRIIQEQLNNIAKHAAASSIIIRLESDAELIELEIRDDGKGFDPAALPKKGLGFTNIANRAGLFNGNVNIEAAPGQGCRLLVSIPLR